MKTSKTYEDLLSFFLVKIKVFLIVGVFSAVASVVFSSSFFITPKYKSEASLYPSNLIIYSTESPTEQLLQLFHGNDIRDSIIQKFDLIHHYEIDTTCEKYHYLLNREYDDNVSMTKTNFESVNIKVLDKDPVTAKDIVTELIQQVNRKIRKLHRIKALEIVRLRRDELWRKRDYIDTLNMEIKNSSVKFGVLDYVQQSREVTAGYMNILRENKKGRSLDKAKEMYDNLKKEGHRMDDLHHQLRLAREDYNQIMVKYNNALIDLRKELTYTNTVVYPEIADRKSYPIRWLIVLISVIGSLLFTFFILSIYNRFITKDEGITAI